MSCFRRIRKKRELLDVHGNQCVVASLYFYSRREREKMLKRTYLLDLTAATQHNYARVKMQKKKKRKRERKKNAMAKYGSRDY